MKEGGAQLSAFVGRMRDKGAQMLRLLVRVGEAKQPIDEYALVEGVEETIYEDARANADGVLDPVSAFVLEGVGGSGEALGVRSFSVMRGPSDHMPDRFDTSEHATIRMLLEQNDRSHRIITQAIPQTLAVVTELLASMTGHAAEMAATHRDAAVELRASRAEQLRAELETMRTLKHEERIDALIGVGTALLPSVVEAFAKDPTREPPKEQPPKDGAA